VTRESRRILEDHAPRRLTNGEPGSWQSPCADPNDESNLFTLNRYTRSDLVRYDSASRTWKSDWESVPGEEVSWSPDRQWVTYTRLPDYSIWKSRPDGSARIRLTASGIEARQPHWSPEGKRIAFMGKNSQGAWRVYRIQVSGGTAEELVPHGEDQGVPTWSPDGRSLIFGERLTSKPRADMSIHVLDLTSRKLSEMPGTRGLWSPRWSPDGKYVLAITTDSRALRILNCDSGEWREVSRMLNIDHASWSPNSQYVQFVGQDINNRRSLYRLVVANSAIEPVVDITTFDGGTDSWFGISPDGSPIAHRDLTVEEIFKLKVALP
jgi:Tol biopolymer transport system component